tara:strand:- start:2116 stop:2364 length:249 start_codon:yes stop_codon:yes gene_type:complete
MSNESESKTEVWFTLRGFMDYLAEKNERLYEEALDCVSTAVAAEHGQWLHAEWPNWDTDDETGRMCVLLTNVDPHPDITASE